LIGMANDWFTIRWTDSGVVLIDQRQLPEQERYLTLTNVEQLAQAIESLAIRGAPAIGCAAAMGVALGARTMHSESAGAMAVELESIVFPRLARTRPTAVNLFWALDRMRGELARLASAPGASVESVRGGLVEEAESILAADIDVCRRLGKQGAPLLPDGGRVLTHCNAGGLATGGYGTALGVVRAAVEAGRRVNVVANETRPLFQGARLTAWELSREGIPVTVCTDSMAGHLMQRGEIDLVLVGADRVAANGDVANKIGTYGLAVLAHAHGIPFYVAAPCSTIDLAVSDGAGIPIEERGRDEVARVGDRTLLPKGVPVYQPAFDVTPARLVDAIITERRVVRPPFQQGLKNLF
jgi:methylthioribose-1-phosphate isomerase